MNNENTICVVGEEVLYEPPFIKVYDLKVELAFLQDTASASGFGDPGSGW